ncbi:hypothetical protein GYMLUDRAFT_62472 [Collybiopsis luxurians FD-317 M1]|uniref:Uncharacterized protein n=1 Tax=Collybiopsis luxurians FD-317 M1 TaxID=944289 RepID=A0A0D0AY41_9AGAR|nr:hypothetical protein GYMLUDRAFT_62472 [Collybiopsis luxurians FD-317 M1]
MLLGPLNGFHDSQNGGVAGLWYGSSCSTPWSATYCVGTFSTPKLNAIPTVGPTGYLSVSRFWTEQGRDIVQEGYNKYPNGIFKVALPDQWMIIIHGHQLIEDTRKASEEELTMTESLNDGRRLNDCGKQALAVDYTLTKQVASDPYHVAIVRTPLTRNIAAGFGEIREEMELAFAEYLAVVKNGARRTFEHEHKYVWSVLQIGSKYRHTTPPSKLLDALRIGISSGSLSVAIPTGLNHQHVPSVFETVSSPFMTSVRDNNFIDINNSIRKLAGRFLTKMPASMKRATKLLQPIIQARLAKEEEHGGKGWPGKPNDVISWLIDEAKGEQRNIHEIIARVLAIEVAAIHTTSTVRSTSLSYPSKHFAH